MTNQATTTRRSKWNSALATYTDLSQKLAQAQGPEAEALERAVAAQQDELLDLSSPTLAAVRIKLEVLWEAELDGFDQASEEKRLILEDLSDLGAELGELLV
ncbi:hypothetical protein [Novosphingobium sp. Gsoil 351]|uniref:hypothetical protein n=1 Tax=Novosphingobium sp. Gsoil 351 TaxID=2675225 RepID=UPI0012B46A79|nr:hypothetical protein [Novosphingobium sp. Gsoil 351]QGN54164.1 hypothetical protein GKE62_06010 [Novosphingobium sp. Gsoil 351]